jgi:hypothetical protein
LKTEERGSSRKKTCLKAKKSSVLLLEDEVHRQAKHASARLGIPLTRFIEEAIRLRISTEAARRAEPVRKLSVCKTKGGLRLGVDLDNTAEALNAQPPVSREREPENELVVSIFAG